MAQPLYDTAQIETPEQIEVSLPLAGVGTRATAYLIDFLCQIVVIGALGFALFVWLKPLDHEPFLGKDPDGNPKFATLPLAIAALAIFLVNFGYFAIFEARWRGQSPGKRALGLRVIRDGGFPLDGRTALIRNLLRIVDFLPAFYVVGMVSIFLSDKAKRIGDHAAGTLVVREPRVPAEGHLRPEDFSPSATGILNEGELALVESFLDRRHGLDPAMRHRLGQEIAARLADKVGEPLGADAERYLEGLLSRAP